MDSAERHLKLGIQFFPAVLFLLSPRTDRTISGESIRPAPAATRS